MQFLGRPEALVVCMSGTGVLSSIVANKRAARCTKMDENARNNTFVIAYNTSITGIQVCVRLVAATTHLLAIQLLSSVMQHCPRQPRRQRAAAGRAREDACPVPRKAPRNCPPASRRLSERRSRPVCPATCRSPPPPLCQRGRPLRSPSPPPALGPRCRVRRFSGPVVQRSFRPGRESLRPRFPGAA